VEISKDVTLEIAREVAGRVKQSVIESMQQGTASPAPAGENPLEKPAGPKRIPLDDLDAIINQITGQGP